MSHPPALLAAIRSLLESDYPSSAFRYTIEKVLPGTRLFPDITVRGATGAVVCVAEIGYTRPEKLTAYKTTHHIPDVRWYDKRGTLHPGFDTRLVRARVEITLGPGPR